MTFTWPEGKQAALSLSFDDARETNLDVGIPLFNRLGVKVTFYVSLPSFEKRIAEWRNAAAAGHEIGNHSMTHPCSGNFLWCPRGLEDFTLADMEKELIDASDRIEQLTGLRPKTFAYPCGHKFVGRGVNTQSYVPIVARHFLAGRGFRDEPINNPLRCDLAQLQGTDMDGIDFASMKSTIDYAIRDHSWVIFAGHEIGCRSFQTAGIDALEQLVSFARENGIWLDTVATIAEYVRSKQGRR